MVDEAEFEFAIAHLRRRVEAEGVLESAIAAVPERSPWRDMTLEEQEHYAGRMIEVVKALRLANRLSFPEYVAQASFWAGRIHEGRMESGFYAAELEPIENAIQQVENDYGLESGEFWYRNQGPLEWQELNRRFDIKSETLRIDVLREFHLEDLADLSETDPARFDELYRVGFPSSVTKPADEARLEALLVRYRRESSAAEASQAFYSAAATRGAALEALLLLRCIREPDRVTEALENLPARGRLRNEPFGWTLGQLIFVAHAAGWLPSIAVEGSTVETRRLAESIKHLRNLLHPGRHLRESAGFELDEENLYDARTALVVLESVLEQLEAQNARETPNTGPQADG